MMFNHYWFENGDDPHREWERQKRFRATLLAAAVHTFFPDIPEFIVISRIGWGCYEI